MKSPQLMIKHWPTSTLCVSVQTSVSCQKKTKTKLQLCSSEPQSNPPPTKGCAEECILVVKNSSSNTKYHRVPVESGLFSFLVCLKPQHYTCRHVVTDRVPALPPDNVSLLIRDVPFRPFQQVCGFLLLLLLYFLYFEDTQPEKQSI